MTQGKGVYINKIAHSRGITVTYNTPQVVYAQYTTSGTYKVSCDHAGTLQFPGIEFRV